jgi:hypothetical protein
MSAQFKMIGSRPPTAPPCAWTAAWCRLAFKIQAAQFHPEKNAKVGLQPLKNFVALAKYDCETISKIAEEYCRLVVVSWHRHVSVHADARINHPQRLADR